MKKLTDFVVKQRNVILVIFLILAGCCGVLMQKVNINRDMTEYLPDTSEVKQGLDIMEAEFAGEDESTMTVMLEGLDDEQKKAAYEYLKNVENVSAVAYDESENYNRDGYTRYDITIAGAVDSEIATDVYQTIEEHFTHEDYQQNELTLGGEVAEQNHEVLPMWIIVMAVGCALIILIIMSESYVEPFLFLATILIAVLLNKGTNLMFPSVSNITDSITAILQLALSMDYSIMLMNRYSQEKRKEANKVEAMKLALYNAFKSISSSSVTTIVGLLALVFMSFTIGKDMGFVLAKGVLFSLLAIFTCLPGLILLFDKAIEKTKKKCPAVKLDVIGKVAYKGRYVALGVFVLVFGASYLLQGNLGILYTDSADDKISQVFGNENQMAVIYENGDEEQIAEYCRGLNDNKLEEVLCYGNTIGEKLTVGDLPEKMNNLGVETEVPDYLSRIVYYHYYRQGESGRMTLTEFVRFVQDELYTDENFAEKIDDEARGNIAQLAYFADTGSVLQPRYSVELANILNISAEQVDDLLVYYNSHNVQAALTAEELVEFLNNYVLSTKYGANLDETARAKLAQAAVLTNKTWLNTKLEAGQMAAGLGFDAKSVTALYDYYGYLKLMAEVEMHPELAEQLPELIATQPAVTLTPVEFVGFVLEHQNDEKLAGSLDAAAVQSLRVAYQVMQNTLGDKRYSTVEAAELLGVTQEQAKLIYSLYEMRYQGKEVYLSLYDFVQFLLGDVVNHAEYSANFDQASRAKLYAVNNIMQQTLAGVSYTATELGDTLASLAGEMDVNLLEMLYIYHGSKYDFDEGWQLTIEEFVNYIAGQILSDVRFDEFLDETIRTDVESAQTSVADAKAMLVGDEHSRIVLNTSFAAEDEETFNFIEKLHHDLESRGKYYVVGDSAMAYEMSQTFGAEMNTITVITMIFIFVVVALTFGSILVPVILVLLIQCAVFMTMGFLSMSGTDTYFIALLIVQSILMGATIDYAILYTSYYIELRETKKVKEAIGAAYNRSIHAIATSSSILILVTLIVGGCTTGTTSMILLTISKGTICATLLILVLLPAMLAACDKLIMRRKAHA